ncbi:MAG: hypothetical protein HYZ37_05215 [Candidatus Solibacter usitatus]|nr:hypothetical protein [Candidatus Solibacter usitatus]
MYTKYTVAVTTQWKGAPSKQLDVYVPGGKSGALVQRFSGAPSLAEGVEYVLFLWSGRSGMRQVIGLSQGLFQMVPATQGEAMVKHAASRETMVDASGKVVEDTPASMRLREMVDRIHRTLAGAQVQ